MFQIPTLHVWILILASFFFLSFFFNQKCGAHPSILKSNRGFLEVHFFSGVEIIILKSGWLARRGGVDHLQQSLVSSSSEVQERDAQMSDNNLQCSDGQWLCWDTEKNRTPWSCCQVTDLMHGLEQIT